MERIIAKTGQLARIVGKHRSTIKRWHNSRSWIDAGLPRVNYPLERVLGWCAANNIEINVTAPTPPPEPSPAFVTGIPEPIVPNMPPVPGAAPPLTLRQKIDIQERVERTKKIKLEHDIKANKFVLKAKHNEQIIGMIVAVRKQLEQFLETYPTLLAKTNEPKIRMLLTQWYDTMCGDMMEAGAEVWVDDDEKNEVTTKLKTQAKVRAAHRRHSQRN